MSNRKKVLVVDDSLIAARTLISIVNESDQYEVIGHAKNGAEAIKMYRQHMPSLVTMDLIMPVMDGIQAIRAIIGLNSTAKIMVVSSIAGSTSKTDEALKAGAASVITKPFDPETVKKQLEDIAA